MDFEQIKNLIPFNGEKYIIIENGKPVLVLMSFEDYKKGFNFKEGREIKKEESLSSMPQKTEKLKNELTLEDLPF